MKDRSTIKRKLLTDRKLPDSEQISQHKDFKSIKQNYSMIKSSWLKKLLIGGGTIVGTAVVAALIYINGTTAPVVPARETQQGSMLQQEAFIRQPLPGADVPFSSYKVSVKNGGIIRHKTGSTVTIPANAFAVSDGSVLKDSITIEYREFHTPYNIFLSGIPMKYDSAGVNYTFESAGMMEIKGHDGNKELVMNSKKEITVSMASANEQTDFNLYYLDTLSKNWVYKGKDKILPIQKGQAPPTDVKIKKATDGNSSIVKAAETVKPELADPNKYCFNIGYDKNEFPELKVYDNVLFEVADNSFKPSFYKISWDKISLHSTDSKGLFVVKLKKADTTISVKAKPVFDKENYSKALIEFDANHKKVEESNSAKDAEVSSKLNEIDKELASYNRADFIRAANFTVDRKFSIRSFGVFNCDRPILAPVVEVQEVAKVLAQKESEARAVATQIGYSVIYVVEKGKNAVFTFSKNESVRFNPNLQNLIWTVTDKKEIAFFRASDFKNASIAGKPLIAVNQEVALAEIRNFSK